VYLGWTFMTIMKTVYFWKLYRTNKETHFFFHGSSVRPNWAISYNGPQKEHMIKLGLVKSVQSVLTWAQFMLKPV